MTATPPTAPPTIAPIGAKEPPDLAAAAAAAVVLAALLLVVAEPALDALGVLDPVAATPKLLKLLSEVDDFVEDRPVAVVDNVGL